MQTEGVQIPLQIQQIIEPSWKLIFMSFVKLILVKLIFLSHFEP